MAKHPILSWLTASAFTYLLAVIAHSQSVLQGLVALGVDMPASVRIDASLHDFLGMLPGYGPVILFALGLGLLLINWLFNQFGKKPGALGYSIAGFIAIACALLAMHPIMHITLIAGAREPVGFLLQCLSGAAGGWLFSYLRAEKPLA